NTYQFYTKEMTEKTFLHMLMTKNIRNAIDNQEFVVYYQPQIDAVSRKIVGMEALVRWQSPTEGLISPGVFIPIAEDAGLIDKIGELVFIQAATQIAAWYGMGLNPGRVAINISAIELQKENFVEVLQQRLIDLKCKYEWIELEITEGYTMKHPNEAIKMLQKISDLGIHLSIDDFGTGYSSLSYLKKLPIHKLKIDQSFVRDIPKNRNDAAIVLSIIFLAKTMKFDVIAEGVETHEQQAYLVSKGCHNIQGYLNAKPMPSAEMETFLRTFT
ncbi:MAG TPA: EAL domain-containing protein, partial [Sulfuricurvum sp.]|nr:EAL domain-containing protein [Sulfuricurvum sp.]